MNSFKIFSTSLFLTSLLLSCNQKVTVSKAVLDAFASKFEQASSIEWEKETETEWEAEFKMNGINYSANFGVDGNWLETENEVEIKDIPKIVLATLNTGFTDFEIEKVELSITTKGTFYEFEIEKNDEGIEVVISKYGEVIKKEDLNNGNVDED